MQKITALLFCFLGILGNSHAQDVVKQIRSRYIIITQQVADCNKETSDCNLYSNSLTINEQSLPWRGSGIYKKVTSFWYDDSPSHCDECGENGIESLKFISSNTISGLTNSYEEWLFQKGNLVFYYQKNSGEYSSEFRYYYWNKSLIRFIGGGEQLDGEYAIIKDQPNIIIKAHAMQQTYLLGFK